MSELKNCPFSLCNGEAEITPKGDYHEARCKECGCSVQAHTYEEVERLWNTRTASPRFTTVEREAMNNVIGFAKDGAEMGFENDLIINGEEHASCAMNAALRDIATVRKMLEGSV